MDVTYQFNSAKLDEVSSFFKYLGLKPQYRILEEKPASGIGRLVQAELEVKDVPTLLDLIDRNGLKGYWAKSSGTIVRE
ncbi:hypothetical protein J4437_02205 [Candidatus Woesearchaeota archaeon]|nr:hypothetical protein [Candidatus Woesearchaeota archaeon]